MADEDPTISGHVNSQPSSMQTSATSSGNCFTDFQTVTQYQIMLLQRMVPHLRETVGRDEKIRRSGVGGAGAPVSISGAKRRLELKKINSKRRKVVRKTAGEYQIMQRVTDLRREVRKEKEKNKRLARILAETAANVESLEVDVKNLKKKNRGQDDYNFVAMKNVQKLKSITGQIVLHLQADEHTTTSGHVNSQPSSMQTSATSSGNYGKSRDQKKIEQLSQKFIEATENIKRLEAKLVNLQSVVGKQTDDHKKLQKDSTDKYTDGKSQITAVKLEIATLKQTVQSSLGHIEEIRRSFVRGTGAPVSIPENFVALIHQHFERSQKENIELRTKLQKQLTTTAS